MPAGLFDVWSVSPSHSLSFLLADFNLFRQVHFVPSIDVAVLAHPYSRYVSVRKPFWENVVAFPICTV